MTSCEDDNFWDRWKSQSTHHHIEECSRDEVDPANRNDQVKMHETDTSNIKGPHGWLSALGVCGKWNYFYIWGKFKIQYRCWNCGSVSIPCSHYHYISLWPSSSPEQARAADAPVNGESVIRGPSCRYYRAADRPSVIEMHWRSHARGCWTICRRRSRWRQFRLQPATA